MHVEVKSRKPFSKADKEGSMSSHQDVGLAQDTKLKAWQRHDFRLQVCEWLSVAGGRHAHQWFQSADLNATYKSDDSVVTEADVSTERWMRQGIKSLFPRDGVLGEELEDIPGESGYRWVIDPIDGTQAFVHGVPLYGTLVGVECDGQPLCGAIYLPGLDELISAQLQVGANWWPRLAQFGPVELPGLFRQATETKKSPEEFAQQPLEQGPAMISQQELAAWVAEDQGPLGAGRFGQALSARPEKKNTLSSKELLKQTVLATTDPRHLFVDERLKSVYMQLAQDLHACRGWGDSYAFVLAATGRVDCILEAGLKRWDIAAALPIFQETGLVYSDFSGGESKLGQQFLVARPSLHALLRKNYFADSHGG